jgi:hypothetical protein
MYKIYDLIFTVLESFNYLTFFGKIPKIYYQGDSVDSDPNSSSRNLQRRINYVAVRY